MQLPRLLGHSTVFCKKSLNDSVLSQTKLCTMAKNLRIPLGHGGPTVDEVSETSAWPQGLGCGGGMCGCSGAPSHQTCPKSTSAFSPPHLCLHSHTLSHMPDSLHLLASRFLAPSSGKPSLTTFRPSGHAGPALCSALHSQLGLDSSPPEGQSRAWL